MSKFDNVSVIKAGNVYFDGKCISHTVLFPDGSKKTLGVILPSSLVFNTAAAEVMECVEGVCQYRLPGVGEWKLCKVGESFSIPENSSFEIQCDAPFHYVCYYAS